MAAPVRLSRAGIIYSGCLLGGLLLAMTGELTPDGVALLGGTLPFAFVMFGLVLVGVAIFHQHAVYVAAAGALLITAYTATLSTDLLMPHGSGGALWNHLLAEGRHTLVNLAGLLLGFALLTDLVAKSGVVDRLVRALPRTPQSAALVLLGLVWVISAFVDNLLAASLGGILAMRAYGGRVTVGYAAALVAATNAGGAWSVIGDTATTMMWMHGVAASDLGRGLIASSVALVCFGVPCARAQARRHALVPPEARPVQPLDLPAVTILVGSLVGALLANLAWSLPFIGLWGGILLGALWRRPAWQRIPATGQTVVFLLSLVWCASLMPVHALPTPGWATTLGIGLVSSVFDTFALTKVALVQGGYDWGLLGYAIGFGGSLLWFGSVSGIVIATMFPQVRDCGRYVRESWPVAVAYGLGFFALLAVAGWNPTVRPEGLN